MAREIPERLALSLDVLRRALGARDVLTNGKDVVWVLASPRRLRQGLGERGRAAQFVALACRKEDPWTVRSYGENATYWGGWEEAIRFGLSCLLEKEWEGVEVFPVPASTLPKKAWSARKKKWLEAGPKPRFRLCDQPAVPLGNATGPVLLEVSSDLPPLFLSHGVSKQKLGDLRKCGGMLWPSFALSWRVPPTYGDVVFFASAMVVAEIVRPTGRRDPRMYLAGTDIWSPDARELRRYEKAVERELSADPAFWSGDLPREKGGHGRRDLQSDLLAEGIGELVGGMSYFDDWTITDELRTRRQLVRRMREIFAAYASPKDPYVYPEREAELRTSRTPYPYGELKVTGRVALEDMPLVVYPRRIRARVERALDELDFRGVRYAIPWEGPLHDEADEATRREFARAVTLAVLRWAERPCHTLAAKVGSALLHEGSWRSRYDPTLWWIVGRSIDWSSGFCGDQDPGAAARRRLSARMRDFLDQKKREPARWGIELRSALDALDDPDVAAMFAKAEQHRFLLSKEDAKIANRLGWFPVKVGAGDEVVVIRLDQMHNPTLDRRARLLA